MIKYITIATDDDSYRLESIYDESKDNNLGLNLSFVIDNKIIDILDAEDFLINRLYPYLCGKDIEDEYIFDMLEDKFSNVKEDVKELFDEAIRINLFTP
jgi:hypothetical protein